MIEDSIVLIETETMEGDKHNFGTGFIIHRDKDNTYILTCAHVVFREVVAGENEEWPKILIREENKTDPLRATLEGSDQKFDLAVLKVQGLEPNRQILTLCSTEEVKTGTSFSATGYYEFDKNRQQKQRQTIEGRIQNSEDRMGETGDHTKVWKVEITNNKQIKPGNSGSPALDATERYVLGVVSNKEGEGNIGWVISIETLRKVWTQMPPRLILPPPPPLVIDYNCDQAALLGIDFESATRSAPILKKRPILGRILRIFNPPPELTNEELAKIKYEFVRTRTRLLATVKNLKLSDETCQFIKDSLEPSKSDSEQDELISTTKNIIIDELNRNLGVEIGLSFQTGFLLSFLSNFCILSNLVLQDSQTDWFEGSLETIKILKEDSIKDIRRIPKNLFPGLTENVLEGWFNILEEAASNKVNNNTKTDLLNLFEETNEYLSVFFEKINLI